MENTTKAIFLDASDKQFVNTQGETVNYSVARFSVTGEPVRLTVVSDQVKYLNENFVKGDEVTLTYRCDVKYEKPKLVYVEAVTL